MRRVIAMSSRAERPAQGTALPHKMPVCQDMAKGAKIVAVPRAIAVAQLVTCAVCLAANSDRTTNIQSAKVQTAQYEPQQSVSVGSILVAKEKLGDPNFAESVVLIVQYDEDEGTLGIVINRPSDVPLSQVFPHIKHATADPVYMGGPVGITAGQALLRLTAETDDATHILGDVYVTASKKLIEKSVASHATPAKFRLFLGYAGWAPGQLEAEIRLGAWSLLKGHSKIIFDDDPSTLWDRLNRETHWQMAKATRSLQRIQIDKTNAEQSTCVVEIERVVNASKPRTSMAAIEHHVVD